MKIKLFNIYFSVTYTALVLITIVIVSDIYTNYLMCLLSVIIHELGHFFGMCFFGCVPREVKISAFDIKIIENKRAQLSLCKDIFITILGPAFNIIIFILTFFTYKSFAYINLFIAMFNLMPSKSLDGGQLLYLFLTKFMQPRTVNMFVDLFTILISLPLFFIGILLVLKSKYNFSLLIISVYLILSVFLKDDKYL